MSADEKYMREAIALAKKAEGLTNPNPAVGAVVVKGGKIVGKGYHKRCGLPHAEVNALGQAGARARGATLYVTLEPCDHYGRTPPCTEAVIRSGIKRVVAAMEDPNPITRGRGIRKLRAAGISSTVGVLAEEAASLNKPFITFMNKKRPYVTVKIAESLDGKIATRTGDSKWITSDDSRAYVQKLRYKADAVMVGVNTVIKDDPMLLSRMSGYRQPARVIIDSRLTTPLNAKIFSSVKASPVIIATTRKASSRKAAAYAAKGAVVVFAGSKGDRVGLKDLLKKLGGMGIIDLLVEGGGELVSSLLEEKLIDRFLFFIAPKIVGGRDAVTSVEGRGIEKMKDALDLRYVTIRRFAKDILIEARAV
jgi:diaminohydroxyphosphoribosylaminopyrimidine deaminase/5-amino-6-(5-phosphoribosylamino)uracil reductase